MNTIDSSAALPAESAREGAVMVVDDDPAHLELMEKFLRPRGYEVVSFPGGRVALAAASEKPPDLILLDVSMPEMTGFEVCQRLKANANLSEIPVIFLSALNAHEDRIKGFQVGGIDYISKPFQFDEVQARVDAHVRLRRLQLAMEADKSRLEELVQIQVKKIADAHMETIFAIARLAEARDDETRRHLERVQTFCRLLAAGLGRHPAYKTTVSSTWIGNIFHASPLHDIGKVAIPDRILLKPGSLTPAELAIMKTHTTIGSQTLKTVHDRYPDNEFIAMGIEIARSHHERWDSTGYPDGLAGEGIPLCARILAVADCYDASRAKRCYKPATPHDETCAIILEESGKHFDPVVIAAFRELTDAFEEVWNRMNIVPDASSSAASAN